MTELVRDEVRLRAPRPRIWAIFEDARALARVLPGCESLEQAGPGRYHGVLATKIQFLTLRADVTAELRDPRPPTSLRVELTGRPIGLIGSFRVSIPIELEEASEETIVRYRMDVGLTGRLATFGAPLLRETARR